MKLDPRTPQQKRYLKRISGLETKLAEAERELVLRTDTVKCYLRQMEDDKAENAALLAQVRWLRAALAEIKDTQGKVCNEFGLCEHRACASSYTSWAIADKSLAAVPDPGVVVVRREEWEKAKSALGEETDRAAGKRR